MFKLILQLHGGGKGGSSTTVQSYKPTPEERRLQAQAAKYSEATAPNALALNTKAYNLLNKSLGDTKIDYTTLNNEAQGQIGQSNQLVADLAQGKLPSAYEQNMQDVIKRGVTNSMGGLLTDLGSRGVINSSVMNTGVQGISDAAANAMAEAYQKNIGIASGLAGQMTDQATAKITAAAAAQEAQQQPALNLWNASVGLNSGGTLGALQGVSGKGTTTATQSMNNGGGVLGGTLGGLFGGLASGWASAWCFAEDTMVKMADGIARKIRHIKAGDEVICPHKDGTESVETVTEVMNPHYADVYVVVTKDKEGKEHHCNATASQPLLANDGEFINVEDLKLGKELYGGWKVVSIIYSGERKVYDLKVSGENNYYADGFVARGGTNEW